MRKTISAAQRTAAIAALLAVSALAGALPATAASPARAAFAVQDQLISAFCGDYPGASSCGEWQSSRDSWNNARYQSFYRDHRYESGLDTAAAATAFRPMPTAAASSPDVGGRTLEPAVPAVEVIGGSDDHVDDCQAAFRSYDTKTDTYMALDGTRHKCKL